MARHHDLQFTVLGGLLLFGLAGCQYSRENVVIQVVDENLKTPVTEGQIHINYFGGRIFDLRQWPADTYHAIGTNGITSIDIALCASPYVVVYADGYETSDTGLPPELPTRRDSPFTPGARIHYVIELANDPKATE